MRATESLALEIGVQGLFALDAEHDGQVKADGRQPRHQWIHAARLEPHDLAGMRDRVRSVGFGEIAPGNKSLGFGVEGGRNVDRDVRPQLQNRLQAEQVIDVLMCDEQSLDSAAGDEFGDPGCGESLAHVVAVPARVDQEPPAGAV